MAWTSWFHIFSHPASLHDLTPEALQSWINQEHVPLIDVRTAKEFRDGHIQGARSLPLGQEEHALQLYAPDQPVILICKTGHRSQAAARTLIDHGFKQVYHLKGGMDQWRQQGYPTKSSAPPSV
ncbi:MAG: rhodanese-like domain-containing protein [Firmicutes bacterium]|nr:rhodanese-like domain-containing protein [Bacillota bacterium]